MVLVVLLVFSSVFLFFFLFLLLVSLVIFLSLVVLLVILFLCRLGLPVRGFSHLGSLMVVRDAYGHECWRSVVAVCLMLGHVIGVLSSSRIISASGHRSASSRPVEMVQFFGASLV